MSYKNSSKDYQESTLDWLKRFFKRILYALIGLFIFANILLFVSGRTYIYTGLKETYLKGRSGPSIYDSLMSPNRNIPRGNSIKPFEIGEEVTLSEDIIEELEAIETTSLLVLKNNKIVFEKYWDDKHDESTKSNSFSVAKSILAVLVGIALDQGYIGSFDEPVSNYLDFIQTTDSVVTINHLLSMTSGLSWKESESNPFSDNAAAYYGYDLTEFMKSKAFETLPDNRFLYKSGNSQLLGMILETASGMSISEFASKYLWSKIGAESDAFWSMDRKGEVEKAFCCFYATTRDFARFGAMLLNNGSYNGEKIINAETLNDLTSISYARGGRRKNWSYGKHFWIVENKSDPFFYARGILGQYILVFPTLDIVIVRTGHKRGSKLGGLEDNRYGTVERYMRNHPRDVFLFLQIAKYISEK